MIWSRIAISKPVYTRLGGQCRTQGNVLNKEYAAAASKRNGRTEEGERMRYRCGREEKGIYKHPPRRLTPRKSSIIRPLKIRADGLALSTSPCIPNPMHETTIQQMKANPPRSLTPQVLSSPLQASKTLKKKAVQKVDFQADFPSRTGAPRSTKKKKSPRPVRPNQTKSEGR